VAARSYVDGHSDLAEPIVPGAIVGGCSF
jgi:hypothetical protein